MVRHVHGLQLALAHCDRCWHKTEDERENHADVLFETNPAFMEEWGLGYVTYFFHVASSNCRQYHAEQQYFRFVYSQKAQLNMQKAGKWRSMTLHDFKLTYVANETFGGGGHADGIQEADWM